MKQFILAMSVVLAGAGVAAAQGGGGMMGGGSGMLVVADDGSLLITQMGLGGGMMGGSGPLERELVSIGPDGQERWRATFDEGWPMRPVNDGDLVVLGLADDWWMGDGTGDGGWNHGGMGGGSSPGGNGDGRSTLVALDLATGQERWRLELEGNMISMPQFTEDGSRLYLTVRDLDDDQVGGGPMHQGDAPGAGMLMTSTVVAVDRSGNVLWTLAVDGGHMGGPVADGGA